mmetsp:Transcript_61407/g.176795  ORF Transcript_61407/g.176795 Transcript_61407/m.176795 type:complete len:451 (+) Transcript_61407:39-1391(+)
MLPAAIIGVLSIARGHRLQQPAPPEALLDVSSAFPLAPVLASASVAWQRLRSPGSDDGAASAVQVQRLAPSHMAVGRSTLDYFNGFYGDDDDEYLPEPGKEELVTKPSAATSPFLTEVEPLEGWRDEVIVLPTEWERQLRADSIVSLHVMKNPTMFYIGSGRLVSLPDRRVTFMAHRTGAQETFRDLQITKLVSARGFTMTLLDSQVYDDATYMLMDLPKGRTLGSMIEESQGKMPLALALPLMVDLLRALEFFEEAGITHGDLHEEKIFVTSVDHHALVLDFRTSCLCEAKGLDLPCLATGDVIGTSPYRHAPEMLEGHPTGPSNNMWQLGLVFARMLLGGKLPTTWVMWLLLSDSTEGVDDTAMREQIRSTIRQDFDIRETLSFSRLDEEHEDLAALLVGMLQRDVQRRWKAAKALAELERAMERRGIKVPQPQREVKLPVEWNSDWQ